MNGGVFYTSQDDRSSCCFGSQQGTRVLTHSQSYIETGHWLSSIRPFKDLNPPSFVSRKIPRWLFTSKIKSEWDKIANSFKMLAVFLFFYRMFAFLVKFESCAKVTTGLPHCHLWADTWEWLHRKNQIQEPSENNVNYKKNKFTIKNKKTKAC
jgi:hypothetical protein